MKKTNQIPSVSITSASGALKGSVHVSENNRISNERARAAELVRGLALEWETADYEFRRAYGDSLDTPITQRFIEDARKVAEQIRSGK